MKEYELTIGETAGKVYKALQGNSAKSIQAIQKEIRVSDEALVNQSVGWLAREGKLDFKKNGGLTQIALVPSEIKRG